MVSSALPLGSEATEPRVSFLGQKLSWVEITKPCPQGRSQGLPRGWPPDLFPYLLPRAGMLHTCSG